MPRYVQARFKQIFLAKEQVANPFDPQEMGAKLKKLQKEDNFYKVRIGSYQVGIYLDKEERIISCGVVKNRRRKEVKQFECHDFEGAGRIITHSTL
jgi:mRNA-degrading endonuclease RelE of RelBE toxin-antitoxin system